MTVLLVSVFAASMLAGCTGNENNSVSREADSSASSSVSSAENSNVNRTYTGGYVGVPENIMKFIMQHVKDGCKITIDSLENFGGDPDA